MDVAKITDIYKQHVEMLDAIEYERAVRWYADARRSIFELAGRIGVMPTKAVEAVAGFNQRLSWEQSLVEATALLLDPAAYRRSGRHGFMYYLKHGTVAGSRKLEDFFHALLGVETAVPIDRHMHIFGGCLTEKRYRIYQSAVYRISETLGLSPSDAQAVIWCGIRKAKGLSPSGGWFDVNSVIEKAYALSQKLHETRVDVKDITL